MESGGGDEKRQTVSPLRHMGKYSNSEISHYPGEAGDVVLLRAIGSFSYVMRPTYLTEENAWKRGGQIEFREGSCE